MTVTIRNELDMTTADVGNSNIAALTGTLLVRFLAGPACDRWGPRWTYIGILVAGAIPTALSGLVRNVSGLIAIRFFVGVLGGTFVPCQVWSTGFFDKNIVGTSNALIGGWGNSGGGITYFLMPLIYDSLKSDMGLTSRQAWRVAFIVPFILISATVLGMVFLCDDTPTGKWHERHDATKHLLAAHGVQTSVLETGSRPIDASNPTSGTATPRVDEKEDESSTSKPDVERNSVHGSVTTSGGREAKMTEEEMVATARGEIVVAPTFKEAWNVFFSLQTAFHASTYICSFGTFHPSHPAVTLTLVSGGELAINSYLASYYLKNFPDLGQTRAGQWASMFGLLNVFTRPLGGIVSDLLYKKTKSLWMKKAWILFVGIISGAFNIAIGLPDQHSSRRV
jgi:MFS transporter, NNP family, nitrate/nitrite transporter